VVKFTYQLLHPRAKSPDTYWVGGYVDSTAGLEACASQTKAEILRNIKLDVYKILYI
jgi:hypothetical protein